MSNRKLEKYIKNAVREKAPEIWDKIEEEAKQSMPHPASAPRRSFLRSPVSLLVCLVLLIGTVAASPSLIRLISSPVDTTDTGNVSSAVTTASSASATAPVYTTTTPALTTTPIYTFPTTTVARTYVTTTPFIVATTTATESVAASQYTTSTDMTTARTDSSCTAPSASYKPAKAPPIAENKLSPVAEEKTEACAAVFLLHPYLPESVLSDVRKSAAPCFSSSRRIPSLCCRYSL